MPDINPLVSLSSGGGKGDVAHIVDRLRNIALAALGVNQQPQRVAEIVTKGVAEALYAYLPAANQSAIARIMEAEARVLEAQAAVLTALSQARNAQRTLPPFEFPANMFPVDMPTIDVAATRGQVVDAEERHDEAVLEMIHALRVAIGSSVEDYTAVVEEPLLRLMPFPRNDATDEWSEWR